MNIAFLNEPELEFRRGERHVDIRFGLMNFGPLDGDSATAPHSVRVGLIGTPRTIEGVVAWLQKCRRGIDARPSKQPNLFPRFPGFSRQTAFDSELLLATALQGEVSARDLDQLGRRADKEAALDEAVEMFVREAEHVVERANPQVVICAPPPELLEALELKRGGAEDDRDETGPPNEPPTPHRAFHDVLKARGFRLPVPIQMIRPETYGLAKRRSRRGGRESSLQDEATRAWNFHVALYYKAGGTPWRIAKTGEEFTTCYVGISFYWSLDEKSILTSMAQVFDTRGEGVIVRGGPARIDTEDRQPHLSAADAESLIRDALATYRREHKNLPARVVVHKTSIHDKDEIAGFRAGVEAERVSSVDLMSVYGSDTKLFRLGYYPPLRGTFLSLDDKTHALYLRGSVEFFAGWPGMYVPHTLGFRLDDVEQGPRMLAEEILALSKQNWNNTQFDGGLPITVRAARTVGDILKHVEPGGKLQARYSFYM